MKIDYYDRRDAGGRNAGIVVTLGPWPSRVSDGRGWTLERLCYRRDATPDEVALANQSTRLLSWKYENLRALLEDERQVVGVTDEQIEALRMGFEGARMFMWPELKAEPAESA